YTTDNPLLRLVTPGMPGGFVWGVKLQERSVASGARQVEMEMGEVFFAPGSAQGQPRYRQGGEPMAAKVREHPGMEVVIQAEAGSEALAVGRAAAV
ncbi:hypothetical protein K9F17_20775, partial [Stenotrophomonas acidaminiphila]|nr:hypothetical protein [Stenotrophomonas acidaminiphila]